MAHPPSWVARLDGITPIVHLFSPGPAGWRTGKKEVEFRAETRLTFTTRAAVTIQ
jgi:hypothetical protein